MEQNNQMIDQLIANQNTQNTSPSSVVKESEGEVLITTARVVSIRYKVYVIILLLLILFLGYEYLQPAYDRYVSTHLDLGQVNVEIDNFENKKLQYESNKKLITTIDQQSTQIVNCLNYQMGCNQLDAIIKENFGTARSYIQLGSLSTDKMQVDEKKILANINEYLTKKTASNPNTISSARNGFLNSIVIGDAVEGPGVLSAVPIRLNVTFTDKDALLSFVDNVEKNVLDDETYRILYKLNEVKYDIVNYSDEQKVDILMYAYFIK